MLFNRMPNFYSTLNMQLSHGKVGIFRAFNDIINLGLKEGILTNFNEENGTHLVSVLAVHHEPMGIYSDKYQDLSAF